MTSDRHRDAIDRVMTMIQQSVAQVNAAQPLTRYPWWWRLWWRFVGVPREVRAIQLGERKRRAELLLAELHRRTAEARVTSSSL